MARAILFITLIWAAACGGEDGNPSSDSEQSTIGTDTDEDGRTDSESDTGTEDAPKVTACLETISGRLVIRGAEAKPVSVIVCIGTCFAPLQTKADGTFQWRHPLGGDFDCIPYNFNETPLHMDFRVEDAPEDFAEYSFLTVPTQADISDTGDTDYNLDLGDIILYALPEEAAVFSPGKGADVSLSGLSFILGPNDLVKYDGDKEIPPDTDQPIRVFKAPLDEWAPPFVTENLSVLYFIGPRWARLSGDGVPLTIEAPGDLSEGDEVTVYLLGSYGTDWGNEDVFDLPDFMYLDADGRCIHDTGDLSLNWVEDGVFQNCGRTTVQNGRIVTPNVPRLTWVGIGK